MLSKLLWRWNVRTTGCYLSPLADIAHGLAMPHAVGVVVGEGVTIGKNVTLYQHVTLGRSRSDQPAYPKIGDNVIVYAGAIVAGGVTVGDGAVIGANAVVIRDVPAGAKAVGNPARLLS
ncbi:serine O-acetyltransferase [Caulobacter rhizosphaerae]|uniref:serine O-acetyltransferase n=1 Tax=Caulobacter rhizosphaerae TaxID=2010972 RepID=UPI0019CB1D20|nr:serine acetyltransferase [Caulobacter rhizosphaerae]GGL18618.1 hypothetical protein GCM10010983_14820 [Caulobacter rhizosphaerae]